MARAEAVEATNIYVAADGSGDFTTVEEAIEHLKQLESKNETKNSPKNIYIKSGDYFLSDKIRVPGGSGEGQGFTFEGYGNGEVNLIGGEKLDKVLVSNVTDGSILDRIIDSNARDKLLQIDVSNLGIDFGDLKNDESQPKREMPTFYIGETPLLPARYPNKIAGSEFLHTKDAKVLADPAKSSAPGYWPDYIDPVQFSVKEELERSDEWTDDTFENAYIQGFFCVDYECEMMKIADFNNDTNTLTTTAGFENPIYDNKRFYFLNMLDEIDMPGESYLDVDSQVLYFMPTDNFKADEIYLSNFKGDMFTIADQSYVTIRNINFKYSIGRSLQLHNAHHITIENCTFAHTDSDAIVVSARNSVIRNCEVYDTKSGGIAVYGHYNLIENNLIHDNTARGTKTYQNSVLLNGSNNTLKNNTIYNNAHQVIGIGGSNMEISYNEIYNACLESGDTGAIYYGRDPSIMGIKIHDNYFHDIGNAYVTSYGQQSIFCDDGSIMPHIYHNIFENSGGAAIKAHGAQFGLVEDNLFVNVNTAAYFQSWAQNNSQQIQNRWYVWVHQNLTDNQSRYDKVFDQAVMEEYKDSYFKAFWDYVKVEDWDMLTDGTINSDEDLQRVALEKGPAYTNTFRDNILVDTRYATSGGNGTEENTIVMDKSKMNANFKFNNDALSEIHAQNPDYTNFDLSKIGYIDPNPPTPPSSGGGGGGSRPAPISSPSPSPSPTPGASPVPSPIPLPSPQPKPITFTDTSTDNWYYNAVKYVFERNLMVGMSDTEFAPDVKVTRGMISTILWRLDGEQPVLNQVPFKDVASDKWYAKSITWMKDNAISLGYEDGEFRPDRQITREEMATIIARYLEFKGVLAQGNAAGFADDFDISAWAKDSTARLKTLGIMGGRGDNDFDPKAQTSRAETAQILMNILATTD
jgi:parallel beta-helix repeat protein